VEAVAESGQIIRNMRSGEIIGEAGATSPKAERTLTVIAKEPTDIFQWNLQDIQKDLPALVKKLKDLAWKHISTYYE